MESPTAAGAAASTPTGAEVLQALQEARERTLAIVAPFSDEVLERVHSTLMSPLVWDLGHIAAFEDLWLVHRYGDRPMLRPDLVDIYDAMETPRAGRGELPFLRPSEAREYLRAVRALALEIAETHGVGDGILHELVLRHEHQHNETMLQTIQLARLRVPALPAPVPALSAPLPGLAGQPASPDGGLELVDVPAGPCAMGAPPGGFAYDNERPRHQTDVRRYRIGKTPITNATYLRFVEGGGYRRREWWSDEGWSWKEQYDITRPGGWTADLTAEWRLGRVVPLDPNQPVVHVSWFEADAFARAHDARLPTEVEWEKAATWDQGHGTARRYPWGNESPVPGVHANVDQLGAGPAPAGAYPAGTSPSGCTGMIGDVWEWTASEFDGYPGFEPYPYREYSEPFFRAGYRVLRGGSWATRARVATPTFRNWDHPQRRQIFSGLRIARDA
jgi:gamma-glutamyl hercynylcysteine S-oxide synthase